MDHALGMGIGQRIGQRHQRHQDLGRRRVAQLAQLAAVHILHRDKGESVGLMEIKHAHDPRVQQPSRLPALVTHQIDHAGVGEQSWLQDLQRQVTTEFGIAGQPDLPHTATTEKPQQFESCSQLLTRRRLRH